MREQWWASMGGDTHSITEMNWSDILEPGCYLMIGSGLLARIHAEEIGEIRRTQGDAGPRVVRLSRDPRQSLQQLRAIALQYGYFIGF